VKLELTEDDEGQPKFIEIKFWPFAKWVLFAEIWITIGLYLAFFIVGFVIGLVE